MKRLTMDMLVAGTLAIAPLAWAQAPGSAGTGSTMPNGTQGERSDRAGSTRTGSAPTTTQRNTPPLPGEDPTVPQRVPTEVPPGVPPAGAGPSTPSPRGTDPNSPNQPGSTTTGSERAGNQAPSGQAQMNEAGGDVALISRVHEANLKEIKMGQMASDKAKSARVKSYARMLVAEHKAMDRQLMALARKKNLESQVGQVAAQAPAQAPGEADMHARLMGETGSEFDQDFMSTMVEEHDKAIQMVRSARDSATDPELRKLFDGALPKLEKHRKTAQDIVDKHLKG